MFLGRSEQPAAVTPSVGYQLSISPPRSRQRRLPQLSRQPAKSQHNRSGYPRVSPKDDELGRPAQLLRFEPPEHWVSVGILLFPEGSFTLLPRNGRYG